MLKKLISISVLLTMLIVCTSCGVEKSTEVDNKSISETVDVETSLLVGTWYCSKTNSCNDMDIVLRITQEGDILFFEREMFSDSGIGGSTIKWDGPIEETTCFYSEATYGEYSLYNEIYLKEYFPRNERWNIYTRDDFTSEKIEGCYLLETDN